MSELFYYTTGNVLQDARLGVGSARSQEEQERDAYERKLTLALKNKSRVWLRPPTQKTPNLDGFIESVKGEEIIVDAKLFLDCNKAQQFIESSQFVYQALRSVTAEIGSEVRNIDTLLLSVPANCCDHGSSLLDMLLSISEQIRRLNEQHDSDSIRVVRLGIALEEPKAWPSVKFLLAHHSSLQLSLLQVPSSLLSSHASSEDREAVREIAQFCSERSITLTTGPSDEVPASFSAEGDTRSSLCFVAQYRARKRSSHVLLNSGYVAGALE